ncbi:TPA: DUF6731 family protein [Clostridioides difficile]|uniref:DUF6731 family protein n=1 Tax=Clostridioides difficile TaxID=1496 RepID=UPI00038D003E|nr:DUF6731 family protein [Clostridioides difficile]EQG75189.1 hypothetical protein QKA_1668 [Clostridioides difficile DA00165]EAA0010259.1 hypothetical protein [Clostridioides difficile]EGT3779793.1 hypothetical protein [Clostridioides difficile]EGT3819172.1 hypothetical protein [Clostridioides difficile]EGT3855929.1 hypothetical protein [Clostridioides difficile]
MGKKNVQFDYYRIYERRIENQNTIDEEVDINNLFNELSILNTVDTTIECMSERARIQNINFDENNNIWEIQFLRLRENYVPGIANEDGEYDIIRLEEGRYIGEFTSALYDAEEHILVLHRNRNSLTPKGVQNYLNEISLRQHNFILKPIVNNLDVRGYLQGKLYRKISIGIHANELEELDSNESYIIPILKNLKNIEGSNINIDVSIGQGRRNSTLSSGLINSIVDDIGEFRGTSSLKVKLKESPDTKVEEFDLLSNRIKDIVEFDNIDGQNPLSHQDVYDRLLECYLERKLNGTLNV